jgi:uridine kinase
VNFDEPAAFDLTTVAECLDGLKRNEAVEVPVYDFVTSRRSLEKTRHVHPADVVVMEGILTLHVPEILKRANMKIFVDTDDDLRLTRRIRRDTVERGRDVEGVLTQYTRFVKPAYEKYVLPSKDNADVIIPWKDDNCVAVDLISQHIRSKLELSDLRRVYTNLHVLDSTTQIRAMHTIIRNRCTSRPNFVFYADRLIRLIIESALGLLPFTDHVVTTPAGETYSGVKFAPKLCGVSMIRSGEVMESALRQVCNGVKLGKILVHRTGDNGSEVAYEKLPHDIAQRHVLLMDPILATGRSLLCAIEELVNHRCVDEGKIILLTLMAAPEGIHLVCSKYPRIKVVTSEIEKRVGPDHTVRPGVGDFGDRYFGTGSSADERWIKFAPHQRSATPNLSSSGNNSVEGGPANSSE